MGGDLESGFVKFYIVVSIHAPAWGATDESPNPWKGTAFQSTPPHGGRLNFKNGVQNPECFNPRPRMGGDFFLSSDPTCAEGFNPRPRMGGDLALQPKGLALGGFNPRPRMGGDHH